MKKMLMLATAASLLATSAYAGVVEKKAMRKADENVAAATAKTAEACGNAALTVSISWDQFEQMAEANADALQKDRYKTEWLLGHAGERTVSTLESLAAICQADEDYKAEIANINVITVGPKSDLSDAKSAFELNDGALTVHSGHKLTRQPSDFTSRLKALF